MEQFAEMAKVAAENKILKEYIKTFQVKNSAHEQCEREFLSANINLKTDCFILQNKVQELEKETKEQNEKIKSMEICMQEYVNKIAALEKSNVIEIKEKEALSA